MVTRARLGWTAIAAAAMFWLQGTAAGAQGLLTEKRVFKIPSFQTQSGRTLTGVKVGWESYGRLNAERSNAILICHFFSGTSHAAGKYDAAETAPGYWDDVIGPGKAIDTDRYFVLSSDTLVNLNAHDPKVTTTGPASIDPATGKSYGPNFPIVTIRDMVEVQRRLVESLGISRLHAVAGPSMGALQTLEWAASHPGMVARAMPVIGAGEADAHLIAWLDVWSTPIRLDPKWNRGDYHGGEPPLAGLAQALKVVTLHANHWEWANATFGRKWAKEGADPAASFDNRFAIEATLDATGAARAKIADANHFLYLAKANQIFVAGGGGLAEGLARIKVPVLLITQPEDLVFPPDNVRRTAELLGRASPVQQVLLEGSRGHLDGVLSLKQAAPAIADFLAR